MGPAAADSSSRPTPAPKPPAVNPPCWPVRPRTARPEQGEGDAGSLTVPWQSRQPAACAVSRQRTGNARHHAVGRDLGKAGPTDLVKKTLASSKCFRVRRHWLGLARETVEVIPLGSRLPVSCAARGTGDAAPCTGGSRSRARRPRKSQESTGTMSAAQAISRVLRSQAAWSAARGVKAVASSNRVPVVRQW
jgi:hypothetical protein